MVPLEQRVKVARSDADLSPEDRKGMEEAQGLAEMFRKDVPAGTPDVQTRVKSAKEEEMEARLAADQNPIARARSRRGCGAWTPPRPIG